MSDLEDYAIKELKDGFTKSGLSTNEWSATVIEDRMEVTETTFDKSGDPSLKTPIIRVSPKNCLDQQIMSTLAVDLQEKETTSWTLSTELALSREMEVSASGDIVIGEGSASTKTGVSFKVGGSASNSTETSVTIKYSQQVPVKPKHQTILELKVYSTPVSGKIRGHRSVRVRYQYDLDVPFQPWDDTHTGTALVRIPFEVEFTSEIITYVPELRERECECNDQRTGALLPGDTGYHPDNHPLHGIPASRGALASARPIGDNRYAIVDNQRDRYALTQLDVLLEAALLVDSSDELAELIAYSGDRFALANTLYDYIHGIGQNDAESLLASGTIDPGSLDDACLLRHPDETSTATVDLDDIRRVEMIGDKRSAYFKEKGVNTLSDLASLSPSVIKELDIKNFSARSVTIAHNQAKLLKFTDLNSNEAEAVQALGVTYPVQKEYVKELLSSSDSHIDSQLVRARLPQNFSAPKVKAALERLI